MDGKGQICRSCRLVNGWVAWKDWSGQAVLMVVMAMWFRQWVIEEATSEAEVLRSVTIDD
jgi:hypothetical protein